MGNDCAGALSHRYAAEILGQWKVFHRRRIFVAHPWLLTAHSGDWSADLQAVGRLSVGIGKPSAFFVDIGANMDYMRPSGSFWGFPAAFVGTPKLSALSWRSWWCHRGAVAF